MSGTDGNPEYPDDRPLSPAPEPQHAYEYEHASIPEPPIEPEPVMSHERAHSEPEETRKRRGFAVPAPSMAFLKPSYWLGRERHEVLPDRPHHEASPAHPEHPSKPRKATPARFPFLGLKRETRVGIALVISFVCLVAAMVSSKVWPGKDKALALAMENPAKPPAKDEKLPPVPSPADAKPDLPKGQKGAPDPVSPPDPTPLPLPSDDKTKPIEPDRPPSTSPVAPPASDPLAPIEPPPASGLPPMPSTMPPKEEPKPADPPASTVGSLDLPAFPTVPPVAAAPASAPPNKPEAVVPAPVPPVAEATPTPTPPVAEAAPTPTPLPATLAPAQADPTPVVTQIPEVAEPVRKASPPPLEPSPPSIPPAVVAAPAVAGAEAAGWRVIPSGGKRAPGGVAERGPVEPAPAPIVADGPRARDDDPAIAPDESALHKVRSGENFWTISRLSYGSHRYYKALHAANARQVPKIDDLTVGMVIRIPPIEALDRSLITPPSPVRAASGAEAPPSTVSRTSTRRTDPVDDLDQPSNARNRAPKPEVETRDEPVRPSYVVKPYQTLRSIARDTLGDPERDSEIRALNREALGDLRNPTAGMTLTLPSDAVVGRRAR